MRCLFIIGVFVLAGHGVESSLDKSLLPSITRCEPGTHWKDDCNFCFCVDSGIGACTRLLCKGIEKIRNTPELQLPSGVDCLPGTTWKSQCNHCLCLGDGYPACTRRECPWNSHEPESTCAPHTIWRDECIICRCTSYGESSCTMLACNYPFNEDLITRLKNEL